MMQSLPIAENEYRDLFGSDGDSDSDSGSDSDFGPPPPPPSLPPPCDRPKPRGFQMIPDFLSPEEQSKMLSAVDKHYPHLTDPVSGRSNQAMYFAPSRSSGLPPWMAAIGGRIQEQFLGPHNQHTQLNQMILNSYAPGNGLMPHVDLHRFADGVAVLSLRSTLVMDLYHPGALLHMPPELQPAGPSFPAVEIRHLCAYSSKDSVANAVIVPLSNGDVPEFARESSTVSMVHWVVPGLWVRVLLTPGSALLIEGEARWDWMHGIREAHVEYWPLEVDESGGEARWISFSREVRSSVTIRTVIPDADDSDG